jgi:hypothetical protein
MVSIGRVGLPIIPREDWPTWGRGMAHHRREAEKNVAAYRERVAPRRRQDRDETTVDEVDAVRIEVSHQQMSDSESPSSSTRTDAVGAHATDISTSQRGWAAAQEIAADDNVSPPPASAPLQGRVDEGDEPATISADEENFVASASLQPNDGGDSQRAVPSCMSGAASKGTAPSAVLLSDPQLSKNPGRSGSSPAPVAGVEPSHVADHHAGRESVYARRNGNSPQPPSVRPPPAAPSQRPAVARSTSPTTAAPPSWSEEARRVDSLPAELRKYSAELKWPESPTLPPSRSDSEAVSLGGGSEDTKVMSDSMRGTKQAIGRSLGAAGSKGSRPQRTGRRAAIADEPSMLSNSSRGAESESSYDKDLPSHFDGPTSSGKIDGCSESTTLESISAANTELSMRFIPGQQSATSSAYCGTRPPVFAPSSAIPPSSNLPPGHPSSSVPLSSDSGTIRASTVPQTMAEVESEQVMIDQPLTTRPTTPAQSMMLWSTPAYTPNPPSVNSTSSISPIPQLTGGYQAAVAARLAQQQPRAISPYAAPSISPTFGSPPQAYPPASTNPYGYTFPQSGTDATVDLSSRYTAAADRRFEEKIRSLSKSSPFSAAPSPPPASLSAAAAARPSVGNSYGSAPAIEGEGVKHAGVSAAATANSPSPLMAMHYASATGSRMSALPLNAG